ncbi:MAG TPA: zinc ribbon domain-containing protein [Candidatus Saccharimonadales bacterium]|nr:zinc ribbon domain-containing protein [Candidatus Saccharimonadales bacterium]
MYYRPHILPHFLPFFFLMFLVITGFYIAYILTLQRAISRCAPQNRATSPESAWLLLIPLFNMFWQFILYPRISETLEREFRARNLSIEPQPLRNLGLTVAVLHVCWIIPVVHFFTGVAGFICLILYWVKISEYSNQLLSHPVLAYAGFPQQPQRGAPAYEARFCAKCGNQMRSEEVFCQRCGTRA